MPKPYPKEFRDDVVRVAQNREEGVTLEQVAAAVPEAELFFFRTSGGAEVDLVVRQGDRLTCIEIKATSSPRLGRGFWSALEDLKPARAWVAAPVTEPFPIARGVEVAPPSTICRALTE